jgi:hypothetical protein
VLVTERFVELARATYESRDLPDGPMIVMPRTEDTEYSDRATMERITDETFRDFIAAMTAPEERRTRPRDAPQAGAR